MSLRTASDAMGAEDESSNRDPQQQSEASQRPAKTQVLLSSLERQWSTGNVTLSPDLGPTSPSFLPAQPSPFHASWTGETNFLGPGATLHSSLGHTPLSTAAAGASAQEGSRPALNRAQSYNPQHLLPRPSLSGDDTAVNSMIHDAARITNWRSVLSLCKSHPQCARYAGPDGWTALHHACSKRVPHAEVAEALIRAYPDALLKVEEKGWTPLHFACRFKAPKDVVRHLLSLYPGRGRAAVSKRDRKGRPPLFYAVRYDAPDGVVEMLLDVDPSAVLDEDRNADSALAVVWDTWAEKTEGKKTLQPFLHPNETTTGASGVEAAQTHQTAILHEKLNAQSKLLKRWNTVNVFLRAAFLFPMNGSPSSNVETDKEKAPSQDGPKKRQWRVLHATAAIKCHPSLFMLSKALYPEQAMEMDENDLYGSPNDGSLEAGGTSQHQTALHLAASSPANGEGGRAVISSLLELHPAAAQVADGIDGSLPLHRIVENERKMHWVLDGVRDVYNAYPLAVCTADNLGRLPLHRASAVSHHAAAVKTTPVEVGSVVCNLLEAYPDAASKPDNSGRLPLHLIAEHGEVWDEEAEAIKDANEAAPRVRAGRELYNRLPIHMAASSPDAKRSLIERLVELHPLGASQTERLGKLPLHLACESGKMWDKGVEKIYLAHPDAIRVTEDNPRRWMALHMAAASPNAGSDLIGKLTEVNPHAALESDTRGRYPLHWACLSGKSWEGGLQSIFEANPVATMSEDKSGLLPFHIAAFRYCSSSSTVNNNDEEGDDNEEDSGLEPTAADSDQEDDGGNEAQEEDVAKIEILFQLLRVEPSVLLNLL